MAKVGLTVVTYKDNFGSVLQTYATQYVVRKNGYETSIFDKYRKETSKIKVSLFENCCIKFICINL